MSRKLPSWLTVGPKGAFYVDPDIAYPHILKLIGVKDGQVNQYWMEVALQCAKLAVEEIVRGTDLDPRPARVITIMITAAAGRKDRWATKKFPHGRGELAATASRSRHEPSEAKRHFWRIARDLCFAD